MKRSLSLTPFRTGFTLFEVLMALALSAMLLVAVLAALDLSIRMSVATPRSLQSAERAAALLRLMATDLRQSQDPEIVAAREPLRRGSRRQSDESEWDGIMGGETWIAGRMGVATRPASSKQTGDRLQTESDSRSVWFLYAGPHSVRDPFPTAGAPRCLANIKSDASAREELTRYVAREIRGDDLSSSENLRNDLSCEVLSKDMACRFRYFDGKAWHSEWNSRTHRSVPHAIEITLVPWDAQSAAPQRAWNSSSDAAWKLVVSLADRSLPKAVDAQTAHSRGEEPAR